jgi:hypothetical protein
MQGNPGMEEATTKKNMLTLDYSSSLCVDSSKVVELETLVRIEDIRLWLITS